MKQMLNLSIFILMIIPILLPTTAITAYDVIDQSSTSGLGVTAIQNNTIFWQSFTPSINNINQVELYIKNNNAVSPPAVLYITVWINNDPNIITPFAETNITGLSSLSAGQSGWFNATLPVTMLTPNNPYYILFTINYFALDSNYGIWVDFDDPDGPYLGGRASTDPTGDFTFKTYYDSLTAALPEIPVNLIPILIPIPFLAIILIKKMRN